MQVQPIQQSPQFKGLVPLHKLTEVIPNTKVSKNLTNLDINCFKSYLYARKFQLGCKQEEIAKLFKLNGWEFIEKSHEYLLGKLGIPKELKPELVVEKNSELLMSYLPAYNILTVNMDKIQDTRKEELFVAVRHELQHLLQNLSILRHESLGKVAVNSYAKKRAQLERNSIEHYTSNYNMFELEQMGFDKDVLNSFATLKEYAKTDKKTYEQEFKNLEEAVGAELEATSKLAKEKMGIIKTGTPEARMAELYFDDFKDIGYYNADGSIDFGKYATSVIECDAGMAQTMAHGEITNKFCGFKYLKDQSLALLNQKDSEYYKSLDKEVQNKLQKS